MTLDQVPNGSRAVVKRVEGEASLRERLVELGFTPGTSVCVERRAPLGDPLHVSVRHGAFAMRRDEARCIVLEEAPWPAPAS